MGPSQKKPRGPSDFLDALYEHCAAGHGEIEVWAEEPAEDEENPALREAAADHAWPLPLDDAALAHRRAAAETVLAHLERAASHEEPHPGAEGARHTADHDPTRTSIRTGHLRPRTTIPRTTTCPTGTTTSPTTASPTGTPPTGTPGRSTARRTVRRAPRGPPDDPRGAGSGGSPAPCETAP